MTISDVLSMNGYAAFIWPAYGLTAVVMVWILVASVRSARRNERTLEHLQQVRTDRRHPSRQGDPAP